MPREVLRRFLEDALIRTLERLAHPRTTGLSGIQPARGATRVAAWSLVSAALGFMAVFAHLAARFNYPDVLDGAAADALPRLLALGETGRAVWAFYACLPLLPIPAGVGAYAALRHAAPNAMRAAVVFAAVAAVSMFVGPGASTRCSPD